MTEIRHRFIETNGIRMHIAEAGEGPLVLLCHGFPELWYSWRHQLTALAEAGYHAVAPDMRGYGQTDAPAPLEAYTQLHLVGDVVGLVEALGERTAVIAGHDWGAPVAWNAGLLRPDIFRAVIALSVPYNPRGKTRPTDAMRAAAGENFFYILYFQEPGVAERELESDTRRWLRAFYYSASGDPEPGTVFRPQPKDAPFFDQMLDPGPDWSTWLTKAEFDVYVTEFERTGFRGGLNWYRNIDRTWELMAPFTNAPMRQPALFVAGERDGVIATQRAALERMGETVPDLRERVLIPGCGHWTQQERPAEVNEAMLRFLRSL